VHVALLRGSTLRLLDMGCRAAVSPVAQMRRAGTGSDPVEATSARLDPDVVREGLRAKGFACGPLRPAGPFGDECPRSHFE
jgi:hypothetical protein